MTDNSLENLFKGIEEARLLFENLKKTIAYTLSHLLPELLPVLLSFLLGFPLGLTSLQVLTIDLLTEIPPSIALIFEPAELDVMKQAPRRRYARLVTPTLLAYAYCFAGTIISIGCVFAYFTVFWINGLSVQDLLFTADKYWQVGAQSLTISSGKLLTADEQIRIRQEANAAWHITLVVSQVNNFLSIFKTDFIDKLLFYLFCFRYFICGRALPDERHYSVMVYVIGPLWQQFFLRQLFYFF